jgi:hypothetical protein
VVVKGQCEGCPVGIAQTDGERGCDDKATFLERVLFGSGSSVRVTIKYVMFRFCMFPLTRGMVDEADGARRGGRSVIHAGSIGAVGLEG